MKHFLFLSLLLLQPLFAATYIPEIKVHGTHLPFAPQTITQKSIQTKQHQSVISLFKTHPSITVKNTSGVATLSIRGASAAHSLVIINGVQMNDPSMNNAFNANTLDLQSIDKIEVLTGAKAAYYGSGALGGVILITLKTPSDNKASMTLEGGSHGYNTQNINAGFSKSSISGFAAINRQESGSIQRPNKTHDTINSDYTKSETGTALLNLQNTPWHNLRLLVQGDRHHQNTDSFTGALPIFKGDIATTHATRLGMTNTFDILPEKWSQDITLTHMTINRDYKTLTLTSTTNYGGRRQTLDTVAHLTPRDSLNIDLGSYFTQERDHASNLKRPHKTQIKGAKTKITWDALETLSFFAATRFDHHNTYKGIQTWQAGVHVDIIPTLILESNIGTGFKYPSHATLFGGPFQIANPQAKPERSFLIDTSLEKHISKLNLKLKATYFYTVIKDVLTWDMPSRQMKNHAKRRIHGLEVSLAGHAFDNKVDYTLSYTHLDAKEQKAQKSPFSRTLDTPRHKFTASLTYHPSLKTSLFIEGVHKSKKIDYTSTILKATTDIRLGASHQVAPHAKIYGRLENALNQNSEEVYGYGRRSIGFIVGLKLTP